MYKIKDKTTDTNLLTLSSSGRGGGRQIESLLRVKECLALPPRLPWTLTGVTGASPRHAGTFDVQAARGALCDMKGPQTLTVFTVTMAFLSSRTPGSPWGPPCHIRFYTWIEGAAYTGTDSIHLPPADGESWYKGGDGLQQLQEKNGEGQFLYMLPLLSKLLLLPCSQ